MRAGKPAARAGKHSLRGYASPMRAWRLATIAAAALALGSGLTVWGLSGPASLSSTPATSTTQGGPRPHSAASPQQAFPKVAGSSIITLQAAHSYTPKAPPGATDDYHCTLVDPHVKRNSMIIASHFFPNSVEVHHAILFLVPPPMVAAARAADRNGKGWTCFGESTLPGQGLAQLGSTPWLAAWAPGHGLDVAPKGTGVVFPAGSLVIMQVHYNLLRGDKPVRVKLMLQTVAQTSRLLPLNLDLLPAPPDIPCPANLNGPLCNRAAALANLGQRFGQSQVDFVNVLEQVCGRNPADPPAGDTTSCTWPIFWSGKILRITPHMHLLGRSMKVVLDPGTPQARVLLDDTDYNFDYQRSFSVDPVVVHPGDRVQVTCSYDPLLHELLPQLRNLPPRFVTWGDGSSDEMCLAILDWVR